MTDLFLSKSSKMSNDNDRNIQSVIDWINMDIKIG